MVEERIDRTAGSDRRGFMPPTGFFPIGSSLNKSILKRS
jgi:hypothetical protein